MKAKKAQPTDPRTWVPPLYDMVEKINLIFEKHHLREIPHGRCLTVDEVYWLDDNAWGWEKP